MTGQPLMIDSFNKWAKQVGQAIKCTKGYALNEGNEFKI